MDDFFNQCLLFDNDVIATKQLPSEVEADFLIALMELNCIKQNNG
mgnify:CR=1 FL=1